MTFIREKNVCTRKEHRCVGCARILPIGTRMDVVTSVYDGEIANHYWCEVCTIYYKKYMKSGEEFEIGELRDNDKRRWALLLMFGE